MFGGGFWDTVVFWGLCVWFKECFWPSKAY